MPDHPSDRIVVGVDGSAPSDAALRWAAREAAMRKVALTVLHVLPPGLPGWGMGYAMAPLPPDYGEMQEEQGQRVLEAALRVVDETIAPGGLGQVRSELVFASPVPTLVDVTNNAQMIVVGCRGQGAWRRGLFGSVSTGLVHHAHCPVAVIHDPADAPIDSRGPVVVGVDGSPASELATAIAFDEASWRAVELVAVHAWADFAWQDYVGLAWPDIRGRGRRDAGTSGWPAGGSATPTWWCTAWSSEIRPPATCSSKPRRRNFWWSEATAAADSRACCSARSAALLCTRPRYR